MSKKYEQNISAETETEALKIARANQRPSQTKEQTKLIAQGIEKGISHYKKQQKIKAREQDKRRKQAAKKPSTIETEQSEDKENTLLLPWMLLGFTWIGIAIYAVISLT